MEGGRPLAPSDTGSTQQRGRDELQVKLEAARTAAAQRAVAEERARIARELHDVIAHSVSVMTVQAGAVRRLLQPGQERERLALEAIESTGREALTEMRRLVGLLRRQGTVPDFSPQPSMRAVDVLVGTIREAGLPTELAVEGEPRELAPGVDLAAYRVIQEALTNALKYAGPARAWVTVRWREDEIEVELRRKALAAAAHAAKLRFHSTDLSGVGSKQALLAALAKGLKLPTHFGNNWDALADSMEDGEWLGKHGCVIALSNSAAYRKAHGVDWTTFEDILAEASDYWRERHKPFWVFVF